MSGKSNPYSSPLAEDKQASDDRAQSRIVDFAELIRRWEPLRIIYNLSLVFFVLALTAFVYPAYASDPAYWLSVIAGGIVSNICFCVGAAVEGYLIYFGFRSRLTTHLFFSAGLLFTAILAWLFIHDFRNFL